MTGPAGTPALHRPAPRSWDRDVLFVAGTWQPARGTGSVPVHDSGTEDELAHIRSASLADVDAAVAAARAAFPGWSATSPAERGAALARLHHRLVAREPELAAVIASEVGTSVRMSGRIQVASALSLLEVTAELIGDLQLEERLGPTLVTKVPSGVVAAITPWNYPLFQAMAKVAGALAAGCTVILKPSGLAPLSAFVLAEAVAEADLPAGVFNLVTGPGAEIGMALAAHPGVDVVSFTGSTVAGAEVYAAAARDIKRVTLELGGKSASVVLSDADLATAVRGTVNSAFLNSGQTCNALTRLVVPRTMLGQALEHAVAIAGRLTLGDPFDERTKLGPLVSAGQVASVREHVTSAIRAGAAVAMGGPEAPAGLERGFFSQPTILSDVTPGMRIAREEVFGPVLVVMAYDSEAEALEIANGTDYGLSGAVWSNDRDRALAFARRMRSGQIDINGAVFNPYAPAGGLKKSGLGREIGRYGVEEFLEPVSIQVGP